MRKVVTLLFIVLVPVLLAAQTKQKVRKNRLLVFKNVTLIDMRTENPKANMTVVVSGNRIADIGAKVKTPKDAQVINASGKYLIPGLWDMHVHVLEPERPPLYRLYLANGITRVRDMGSSMSLLESRALRRRIETGGILGPQIMAAPGKLVDGAERLTASASLRPARSGVAIRVANADAARAAVVSFATADADFIKIGSSLTRESFFAVMNEARSRRLSVSGHVPVELSPLEVSNAGLRSIEHMGRLPVKCSESTLEGLRKAAALTSTDQEKDAIARGMRACAGYDASVEKELIEALVRNGTWIVPTLAQRNLVDFFGGEKALFKSELRDTPLSLQAYWANDPVLAQPSATTAAALRSVWDDRLAFLKKLHQAGIPILAGTDSPGFPYAFPGYSLHHELELLVRSGLSPADALRAATINPAKFLGLERTMGTVDKGKVADLVLLDANPLENISNTKKINAVVLNGRFLDRNALDGMLADVETAAP